MNASTLSIEDQFNFFSTYLFFSTIEGERDKVKISLRFYAIKLQKFDFKAMLRFRAWSRENFLRKNDEFDVESTSIVLIFYTFRLKRG